MTIDDGNEYEKARLHVKRIRGFYSTLLTYIVVNIALLIINLVTNPFHLWFYWVTLIWGVVILGQAFNTFTLKNSFLGREWEERKIKELLDKKKK